MKTVTPEPCSDTAPAPQLTLAATDRLARALREAHAHRQRQAGHPVWRTPPILSLDQWVADVWASTWPAEQLLSSTQALALWLAAIEGDGLTQVLAPLVTAREALRAERLLLRWNIDPTGLPQWSVEHEAWLRWRTEVRARMQERAWLLREELAERVTHGLRDATITAPKSVRLEGFYGRQPAATATLLETLAACSTLEPSPPAPAPASTPRTRRLRTINSSDQFRHLAGTIREHLRAAQSANPDRPPRIAVVLPDPEKRRDAVEGILREYLLPAPAANAPERLPWRWASGRPARVWPWIAAATAVFAIECSTPMDTDTVSALLLAPPLWRGAARAQAAALDYQLRDSGRPNQRLAGLVHEAEKLAPAIAPRLQQLLDTLRQEPRSAAPSTWAAALAQRLAAIGWPGDEALSSSAFQCLRELHARLARLAGMDTILGEIDLGTARRWFDELLTAGFEPRMEHDQPITLLGPEEAAGLPCELMIVCDASIDAFPGRARPTPLLALDAQRRAGIPDASPDTHLQHSREIIAALGTQAAEIQLLLPATDDNGAQSLPSPLFGHAWEDIEVPAVTSRHEHLAASAAVCVLPPGDPVPRTSAAEKLRGTADLFAQWAESPFFAFCTQRLGIERWPQPATGLDPRTQGIILHAALDTLWERLGTRRALVALDEDGLHSAVAAALQPQLSRNLSVREFGPALARLEASRLHDVLCQWLQHEARRVDGFEVVLREAAFETTLAGLPLRLVIDRIDRVMSPGGDRWLVLDYKTGNTADPKGWKTDSLSAPQLPLYAALAASSGIHVPRIDGIGFAHLKDGHPALSVATNWCEKLLEADTTPKQDWDECLAAWTATLEQRAADFLAGVADFDPAAAHHQLRGSWLLPLTGTPEDQDPQEDAE